MCREYFSPGFPSLAPSHQRRYNKVAMKALKITATIIVIIIFLWGLVNIIREKIMLQDKTMNLKAELDSLTAENRNLSAKIEYLKIPENLLKELKSIFNYREQDEKMLIIVPSTTSATKTSGQ